MSDARHLTPPANARLLVAISFHFRPERLCYLEEVLHTLAAFPVRGRNIVVFTNTTKLAEQETVRQLFGKECLVNGHDARLMVETNLAHPYDLSWAHKRLITEEFLAPAGRYTHFVYLEDDERLSFENFAYFLVARDFLRPFGLVPAFLRTEWSAARELHVNTDNVAPVILADRPFVSAGDYIFTGVDNPYCGAFILDRELALEYAVSPSFHPHSSREVSPFDVRERAAMGLTFEAPPAPFAYRVVVPVLIATRIAPNCAWLAHLPNNYANDADLPFGKIAMKDLFVGEFNPTVEVRSATIHPPLQKLNPDLEAVLRPFLDQSAPVTSIVAIGCHRLWAENGERGDCAEPVATGDEAVLLRLVAEGDAGLASTERVPIPASGDALSGRGIYTLDNLTRHVRELSKGTSGNHLLILPDRMVDEMIALLAEDFGFRAVVILSSQETSQPADGNTWNLQRALFDRGFIGLCSVPVAGGEARCFLASDAVRSLHGLGVGLRGHVTMSSLGTNGRFANQLFQYAHVKLYALRHGLQASVPAWEGKQLFGLDDPSCSGLALPELRFGAFTDDHRMLWDMDNPPINIDLWGYFQEIPECWGRHRSLLRRMFQLSPEHERAIEDWHYDVTRGGQRTLVAIHLRRGDYRDHQNMPWFRLVPEDWYLTWLRAIWPTLRDPRLFVATDEPDAIRPIFEEFVPITPAFGASAETLPDHIRDFEVLRRADQLAICNSSFSRMAAILASPTQKCFYPSFQAQGFVPYEAWIDPSFWARFKDSSGAQVRMASDATAIRGIDARPLETSRLAPESLPAAQSTDRQRIDELAR